MPGELSLVSMNNFPHAIQTQLPVTRFGFDIPAILDLLMTRLAEVANGGSPAENTPIQAIAESEFGRQI